MTTNTSSSLSPSPTPGSVEQAYDFLCASLQAGRFQPGERLKIRPIAQTLGLSTMPVRAALTRLVAAGVLEARQQRSVLVPVLTEQRFEEILQVRLALEGLAAELATSRLDDEQIGALIDLHEQMENALHTRDKAAYLQANNAFHQQLYGACHNQLLLQQIQMLWLQIGPIFNALFATEDLNQRLNSHHEQVINGLRKRDGKQVRQGIERDLRYCASLLRHLYQNAQ